MHEPDVLDELWWADAEHEFWASMEKDLWDEREMEYCAWLARPKLPWSLIYPRLGA